jgi:hypothetical protein
MGVNYRNFWINFYNKPIPTDKFDWEGTWDEYDGAEDGLREGLFFADSIKGVKLQIDEFWEERDEDNNT